MTIREVSVTKEHPSLKGTNLKGHPVAYVRETRRLKETRFRS